MSGFALEVVVQVSMKVWWHLKALKAHVSAGLVVVVEFVAPAHGGCDQHRGGGLCLRQEFDQSGFVCKHHVTFARSQASAGGQQIYSVWCQPEHDAFVP
jgi:hypothetical protein